MVRNDKLDLGFDVNQNSDPGICFNFQMANNARVLGIVLMHATGTTAGLFDMLKDKVCTRLCRLFNRNSLIAVRALTAAIMLSAVEWDSYFPSYRPSPPCGQYHIILIIDRGKCVWTTCSESIHESGKVGSQTRDLMIMNPMLWPLHCHSTLSCTRVIWDGWFCWMSSDQLTEHSAVCDVIYTHYTLCRWWIGSWILWKRRLQLQTISFCTDLARYVNSWSLCSFTAVIHHLKK